MTTPCLSKQRLAVHPAQYLASLKKEDVKGNFKALWCLAYDADPILEPEYVGLTYGQVAIMQQMKQAAKGDGGAMDRVLDRTVGKAEQVNKNLNVQGTYAEFMEMVARAEGGIIDVDPTAATSNQSEI